MEAGYAIAYEWGEERHLCWAILDHLNGRGQWTIKWVKPVWIETRSLADNVAVWKMYRQPVIIPGEIVAANSDKIWADFTASTLMDKTGGYW